MKQTKTKKKFEPIHYLLMAGFGIPSTAIVVGMILSKNPDVAFRIALSVIALTIFLVMVVISIRTRVPK